MGMFIDQDLSNREEIIALFYSTFRDSEGESEGLAISRLVETLLEGEHEGFVARLEGKAIGAILFTTLTFQKTKGALMSPVAILTNHQGKGHGQRLIREGCAVMHTKGYPTIFTYGDPNFYSKTGFQQAPEHTAPHKLSMIMGWQALEGRIPEDPSRPRAVAAFNDPNLW